MKRVKSFSTIFMFINLLVLGAYGESVSYDDAKNVAFNFIYSKTDKNITIDDSTHDSSTDKELHIIRLKPNGWVNSIRRR